MRTLYVVTLTLVSGMLAIPSGAGAASKPATSDLTVVLDFKGPRSSTSIKEMEREAGLILKSSGFHLAWAEKGKDPQATYNYLAVMTFRGSCEFDPGPPRSFPPGPYAFTHISNGEVLPFGEVDCDRIVSAVREATLDGSQVGGNQVLGRALGRVVAHELVHMVTRSTQHASDGVEKTELSGKQLIGRTLALSGSYAGSLRQGFVSR